LPDAAAPQNNQLKLDIMEPPWDGWLVAGLVLLFMVHHGGRLQNLGCIYDLHLVSLLS